MTEPDKFSYLLANPVFITGPESRYLEGVVADFPYCQLGHFMLARGQAAAPPDVALQALERAAAYALSRNALRRYLSQQEPYLPADPLAYTFEPLRRHRLLPDEPAALPGEAAEETTPLPTLSFAEILLTDGPSSPEAPRPTDVAEQLQLIERFIEADPKIGPIRPKPIPDELPEEELSERSTAPQLTPLTETYAKILVRQGKYRQAAEVYEQLGLKFPQKRAYFAEKMQNLPSGTAGE